MLLTTDPACNHPRRGWATLTSFVLQTAAVVIILALPMLQPGLLPTLHAAPPLVPLFIPKFVPVVGQPGGSSIPTRPATLTAPWRIPPTIDRSADKQNANIVAVDEPPCISCRDDVGPGPGILTVPLARKARQLIAIEMDRVLAAQLSVGFSSRPVAPFAGLVRPKAPGTATCVVKVQKLVAAPSAYVVPPALRARTCQ